MALGDRVGDVTQQVCLEVEVEEEVAYGEYVGDEGEADDDLLD
jgi:co-chaperonin GroES (HSP10)